MTTVVAGTTGRAKGTGPSRRIRTEGSLPGVVYGLGQDPINVSVDYAALRDAVKGPAGLNTVFTMDIDGTQSRVLVKEIQRDAVKRTVVHADFLRVDDKVPVKVTLPVHLVGKASKILDNGGIVEQKMFQMRVQVFPDRIPTSIEVDVTRMTPDARISVGDLTLPEGVRPLMENRITIAAPVVTRAGKLGLDDDEEEFEGGGGEGEGGDAAEDSDSSDEAAADE